MPHGVWDVFNVSSLCSSSQTQRFTDAAQGSLSSLYPQIKPHCFIFIKTAPHLTYVLHTWAHHTARLDINLCASYDNQTLRQQANSSRADRFSMLSLLNPPFYTNRLRFQYVSVQKSYRPLTVFTEMSVYQRKKNKCVVLLIAVTRVKGQMNVQLWKNRT